MKAKKTCDVCGIIHDDNTERNGGGNVNAISCHSVLVSLMEKADGERLEELRQHYYELIINDDMYDGLYPMHLKRMFMLN